MKNVLDRPPPPIVALGAVAASLLALPFVALLLRAPWTALVSIYGDPLVLTALRLSVLTSVAATAVALVLGVPLAWLLARANFPGRRALRTLSLLPILLTPVVAGVGLLSALGVRNGLIGPWLASIGLPIPFTYRGVIVAQTFMGMPFLVATVEGALSGSDRRLDEAAATLRAGPWYRFRRVDLPLIAPSLVAGAVLCWGRALGEFGATITLNGNLPGRTQTMPQAIFLALQREPDTAVALSLSLLAVASVVLMALRDRWWPAR